MEPEHVWHRPDVDMKYLCFFLISMLLLSCSRQKRAETLFRGIQSDDYISESFHEVAVSAGKNITIHAGEFNSEGYCLMHELFDTVIAVRLETTEESLVGVVDKVIVVDSCMYVLDKFKTKSVKRFTLEGKYLNVIGQYGEGPEMQSFDFRPISKQNIHLYFGWYFKGYQTTSFFMYTITPLFYKQLCIFWYKRFQLSFS